MYGVVLGQYLQQADYQSAFDYFQELDQRVWSTRPVFSAIQNTVKPEQENVGLVQAIVESILEKARNELDNPTKPKSALTTSEDWIKKRSLALAAALDASAAVYRATDNIDAAQVNLREAYELSEGKNKQINSNYGSLVYEIGNPDSAKIVIENSIVDGYQTPEMETVLKDIYISVHGSEIGYDSYFSSIKAKAMSDLRSKILKKMVSEPAPSFALDDTDGETISLADYKGKIVVLDFWATWCKPCVDLMPSLQRLYDTYSEKALVVVGVSLDEGEDRIKKIRKFVDKVGVSYPIFSDARPIPAWHTFKVKAIPALFLIDRERKVVAQWLGTVDHQALELEIQNLE